MKLLLSIMLFTLVAGCEQITETIDSVNTLQEEGIDVKASVDVTTSEWEMKHVAGIFYLHEVVAGVVVQCIVLDTSGQTLYSELWRTIPAQDALRVIETPAEQTTECAIN